MKWLIIFTGISLLAFLFWVFGGGWTKYVKVVASLKLSKGSLKSLNETVVFFQFLVHKETHIRRFQSDCSLEYDTPYTVATCRV